MLNIPKIKFHKPTVDEILRINVKLDAVKE